MGPRVHRALRRQGRNVSRKRVEARMRALGLRSKRSKAFRRTTWADESHAPSPNLLNRQFMRAAPHEAWCGDITFIWTEQGLDLSGAAHGPMHPFDRRLGRERTLRRGAGSTLLEQGGRAASAQSWIAAPYRSRLDLHSGSVSVAVARPRDDSEHEPARELLG
jgi:hypothetical protein